MFTEKTFLFFKWPSLRRITPRNKLCVNAPVILIYLRIGSSSPINAVTQNCVSAKLSIYLRFLSLNESSSALRVRLNTTLSVVFWQTPPSIEIEKCECLCDQIGRFLKFLGNNTLLTKIFPKILLTINECKNCHGYFLGNLWMHLGKFVPQHLVTLNVNDICRIKSLSYFGWSKKIADQD